MSLNDKAYCATPTIVRDAARLVTLYVSTTSTFDGAAQFNNGFSVTDGSVSFGGQSQTEVLGAWQFTYGFTGLGDIQLGADTADTLTVNSTEEHYGPVTNHAAVTNNFPVVNNHNVTHNATTTLGTTPGPAGQTTTVGGNLVAAHDCSPVLFLGTTTTITTLSHRYYAFRGLGANTSLNVNLTEAPSTNRKFTVLNNTGAYALGVYISGVLQVSLGNGSAYTGCMFIYNGTGWEVFPL
jgi:hypothetical protein